MLHFKKSDDSLVTGEGASNSSTEWMLVPSGAQDFLALGDTPGSFAGQSQRFVRVKTDESGLEFVEAVGTAGPKGDKGDQGDSRIARNCQDLKVNKV